MSHTPVTLLRSAPGKPWLRIDGFVTPISSCTNTTTCSPPDECGSPVSAAPRRARGKASEIGGKSFHCAAAKAQTLAPGLYLTADADGNAPILRFARLTC